ncbi:integrase catalytic domain-containing protein [Escherichia coli]
MAIDTYLGFLMATPQTGEATRHVICHCLRCFAYMGVPKVIKTDNGSGYTSKAFQQFSAQCKMYSLKIPKNK